MSRDSSWPDHSEIAAIGGVIILAVGIVGVVISVANEIYVHEFGADPMAVLTGVATFVLGVIALALALAAASWLLGAIVVAAGIGYDKWVGDDG